MHNIKTFRNIITHSAGFAKFKVKCKKQTNIADVGVLTDFCIYDVVHNVGNKYMIVLYPSYCRRILTSINH